MDQILQYLNSLYGLPGIGLTVIACWLVGYGAKLTDWFPNRRIPLLMMPAGALVNWALALPRVPEQPLRLYIGYHVVIGALIGAGAWLLHDQVLKDIQGKIPLLGKLLSKTGDVVTPPAPTPPEPPKP